MKAANTVEIEGEEFVSMEYLPGRTLKDIEEQERTLALGRGLAIAKGFVEAVAEATTSAAARVYRFALTECSD